MRHSGFRAYRRGLHPLFPPFAFKVILTTIRPEARHRQPTLRFFCCCRQYPGLPLASELLAPIADEHQKNATSAAIWHTIARTLRAEMHVNY